MKEKKIVINVDDKGKIDAETFDFEGVECVEALDKLLNDLSLQTETTKKDEYFKEKTTTNTTIENKNS